MDILFGAITKEERDAEIARQQAELAAADKAEKAEKSSLHHDEHS
jgi:hypothetical protein